MGPDFNWAFFGAVIWLMLLAFGVGWWGGRFARTPSAKPPMSPEAAKARLDVAYALRGNARQAAIEGHQFTAATLLEAAEEIEAEIPAVYSRAAEATNPRPASYALAPCSNCDGGRYGETMSPGRKGCVRCCFTGFAVEA